MPANVVVPEVGESIVDARVAKWLKKEGDAVNVGDALVELETDKIDLEVAAPQAGVLGKITQGDGADVKVGDVIGVIEDGRGATAAEHAGPVKAAEPAAPAQAAEHPEHAVPAQAAKQPEASSTVTASAETTVPKDKTRATPAARNAAQQKEVDLKQVRGSGEAGRVMRRDVEKAAQHPAEAAPAANAAASAEATAPKGVAAPKVDARPATPAREDRRQAEGDRTEERVRMSKRRATIARRLVEAQATAAMLTTFNEVDMTGVMAVRERHKQSFKERYGVNLGLTSFFVKAAVGALREFPRINAEIQGDEMVLKHYYDIGVAVGAKEGLVVPVLRDADRMSFARIEKQVREFAKAAEEGTLSLADLKGGTFTITNGGVFGSLMSTPILNPPQVGILGLHAIKDRPIALDKQIVIRPMMYLALTYDHRIVDGSEAVQFLVRVKQLVEDPGALLLE
jgi:2-oxoglutarate dehydrogenase E2 component (dihydrolipoamide succinyltransferase)